MLVNAFVPLALSKDLSLDTQLLDFIDLVSTQTSLQSLNLVAKQTYLRQISQGDTPTAASTVSRKLPDFYCRIIRRVD